MQTLLSFLRKTTMAMLNQILRWLKKPKGKPDAYSLVSCAAFATMSLGLSNLTQFGFQIDLLYFFCGGLLVQLMEIKMWLVIVGGSFSYSLIQICDYPRHTQRENLPLQLQNLVNIQVDPRSVSSSSHEEAYADVDNLTRRRGSKIPRPFAHSK
ncbi:hypothetical protein VIGAN_03120400 [Vigna angularis var. angularis]|uniref:Uncharacterized protein n=1 Tax=Vigna angularis var. angularis TaxID=157739 RepID=A0A0S3RLR1_PHAAN|nr:hypothetical protein VIGAN_03120400 [Vigna angularis var. angularis]